MTRTQRNTTSLLCGKCNGHVSTKAPDALNCNEREDCCAKWFHLACTEMKPIDFQVHQKLNKKFSCKSCKTSKAEDKSTPNTKKKTNKTDKKQPTLEDVMALLQDLRTEMKDYQKDLKYYAESYEEQKTRNAIYEEEITMLKKENEIIKNEIRKLKNEHDNKTREKRKSNLLIVGIMYKVEAESKVWIETTKKHAEKSLKYVCPDLREDEYKIRLTNINKNNCPILIEFQSQLSKNKFQENRKNKGKINAKDCGISGEETPIYFNDDLSKEQKMLYGKARILKQAGYKYVWAKDGNIFVRETDNSKIIKIRNEEDINNLQQ